MLLLNKYLSKISLAGKLTLLVGSISSFITFLSFVLFIQLIFYSTELQIKNTLSLKHQEVTDLAKPEKSSELANYLRLNDLSLFIFDENNEVVARYGIYRNLDSETLKSLAKAKEYEDRMILDYGEYDMYTKNNIQISSKNTILYILKGSLGKTIIIILPIIWFVSIAVSVFVAKIFISPIMKARNISHELKTPLTRIVSTLQLLIDDVPFNLKEKIKNSYEELLNLGDHVDSILSMYSANKTYSDKISIINISRELNIFLNDIPKTITINAKIEKDISYKIDKNLIHIIFRNLISNAIKYNTKNGYIKIKLKKIKSGWELSMENPTGNRNETFYSSLGNEDKKESHGLGMTLVKDICHSKNFDIQISNTNNIYKIKIATPQNK
jgi:two-component sensor histidine kinase